MSDLLEQFILESRDCIHTIGENLLALEHDPHSEALINELFRMVHTLKGNSGLFEFPEMSRVLHAAEDLMDAVREGKIGYTRRLADCLLEAMDFVSEMLDDLTESGRLGLIDVQRADHLTQTLRGFTKMNHESDQVDPLPHRVLVPFKRTHSPESTPLPSVDELNPDLAKMVLDAVAAKQDVFLLRYRPDAECFYRGEDPFLRIRQMPSILGGIVRHGGEFDDIERMDCYRCSLEFIVAVFPMSSEVIDHFASVLDQVAYIPLRREGDVELLEKTAGVFKAVDGFAQSSLANASKSKKGDESIKVIKVDQTKIDRLMNLIGEMVVAKNALPYIANRADEIQAAREVAKDIKSQYSVISRIAEEMQDSIMQIRMLPISFVFQRFPRLIRDVSNKLGKSVELIIEGGETSADKDIIEAIADPLIHMIRNSLDHGIEMPDIRVAQQKSPTGHLWLKAFSESDHVRVELMDDGRGIDPQIVKRKAFEKGVIDEKTLHQISDHDAIHLIFAPGFSTADAVTDLSGRGVGMDAVKSTIQRLGGQVRLESTLGEGTKLTLTMPLSMSVTHVMIVEASRQMFGVPMDCVVETVRLPESSLQWVNEQRAALLRGRIVPLLSVHGLLGIEAEPVANADGEYATLVVKMGGEVFGIMVDDFREVIDVILKPLPGELSKLLGYAGSALLGDGSVLMILNVKELLA